MRSLYAFLFAVCGAVCIWSISNDWTVAASINAFAAGMNLVDWVRG